MTVCGCEVNERKEPRHSPGFKTQHFAGPSYKIKSQHRGILRTSCRFVTPAVDALGIFAEHGLGTPAVMFIILLSPDCLPVPNQIATCVIHSFSSRTRAALEHFASASTLADNHQPATTMIISRTWGEHSSLLVHVSVNTRHSLVKSASREFGLPSDITFSDLTINTPSGRYRLTFLLAHLLTYASCNDSLRRDINRQSCIQYVGVRRNVPIGREVALNMPEQPSAVREKEREWPMAPDTTFGMLGQPRNPFLRSGS